MSSRIKVAFIVVDDRFSTPSPVPRFGAAPSAVLHGLSKLPDDVEVHVICCTMGQPANPTKIADNIWFHPVDVPKAGFLRTLHSGCILAVRRALGEIKPDVVHAQGSERWCAVSGMFNHLPKLLTIHGNLEVIDPVIRSKPRAYWKLQTLLQKLAVPAYDGVFCNSAYTEEHLRPSARRTWLVPNPLRSEFFDIPHTSYPTGATVTILNVGLFQARKRQKNLLELAKELWHAGYPVVFRFIGRLGNDEYCLHCRALLDEGERLGYAEYGGMKTEPELVDEMDRAQAMIHCPVEEAFGLVVGEGLSRGLKFFGTAVGGIIDITSGLEACSLHEMEDWKGLAASITGWMRDGAPRVPANITIMRDRYSPEVIARRHLEIYRNLLGQA